jgi:hypothetical protein
MTQIAICLSFGTPVRVFKDKVVRRIFTSKNNLQNVGEYYVANKFIMYILHEILIE